MFIAASMSLCHFLWHFLQIRVLYCFLIVLALQQGVRDEVFLGFISAILAVWGSAAVMIF